LDCEKQDCVNVWCFFVWNLELVIWNLVIRFTVVIALSSFILFIAQSAIDNQFIVHFLKQNYCSVFAQLLLTFAQNVRKDPIVTPRPFLTIAELREIKRNF